MEINKFMGRILQRDKSGLEQFFFGFGDIKKMEQRQ